MPAAPLLFDTYAATPCRARCPPRRFTLDCFATLPIATRCHAAYYLLRHITLLRRYYANDGCDALRILPPAMLMRSLSPAVCYAADDTPLLSMRLLFHAMLRRCRASAASMPILCRFSAADTLLRFRHFMLTPAFSRHAALRRCAIFHAMTLTVDRLQPPALIRRFAAGHTLPLLRASAY